MLGVEKRAFLTPSLGRVSWVIRVREWNESLDPLPVKVSSMLWISLKKSKTLSLALNR